MWNKIKLNYILISFLFTVVFALKVNAVIDVFDVAGNKVFTGDELFQFVTYNHKDGGSPSNYVDMYRFFRDWGGEVTFFENINNREYEVKLGRFPLNFSLLTCNKSRFRWGYPALREWETWNANRYYNFGWEDRWEWNWGQWWDQRGIKFRTSKGGSNELKGAIVKTEWDKWEYAEIDGVGMSSPGAPNDGWDNHRMFGDKYFFGLRKSMKFLGQKIGFNWVNEHYTTFKTTGTGDKEVPLQGDIPDYVPRQIIMRITDDSPENDDIDYDGRGRNDYEGARIYSIKVFINGTHVPEFDVEKGLPLNTQYVSIYPYPDDPGKTYDLYKDQYIETNGKDRYAKYIFRIFRYYPSDNETGDLEARENDLDYTMRGINDIKFQIEVSRDYRIEVSRERHNSLRPDWNDNYPWEADYLTIARAEGNPKTDANRKIITYHYGEYVGTNLFGMDMHGIIPRFEIPYNFEYASSVAAYKFPNKDGKVRTNVANAYFFEVSKEIRNNARLVLKFHNIDDDYNGDFAVEDNDDNDDKPDVVDDYVTSNRYHWTSGDVDEDWKLFEFDRAYWEGWDINNNEVFDDEENDWESDYFFPKGERGYRIWYGWRPLSRVSMAGAYIDSEKKMDARRNHTLTIQSKYNFTINKSEGDFYYGYKRVKDNIRDYANNQQDFLYYRDNRIHTFRSTLKYKGFKNLENRIRYKIILDDRLYNQRDYKSGNFVLALKYANWFPFKKIEGKYLSKLRILKNWMVTPRIKIERQYKNYTYQDRLFTEEDWRRDAAALTFSDQITDKTGVFIGEQIYYHKDYIWAGNTKWRKVFEMQLIHYLKDYRGKPLYTTAGIKIINQRPGDPLATWAVEKTRILYVLSYFQW